MQQLKAMKTKNSTNFELKQIDGKLHLVVNTKNQIHPICVDFNSGNILQRIKDPTRFKDEAHKEQVARIPSIVNDDFDANSRQVSVTLAKGNTNVVESYALIKISDEAKEDKKSKKSKKGKKVKKSKVASTYAKIPVAVTENKLGYTYTVPKEAKEYGIILIDENQFMVKSKFHTVN